MTLHGPRSILLEPRKVPLGGVRDMDVKRILPDRDLPTIGPWCFLDRFGPNDVQMRLFPHPHTGLQILTWPLVGGIHHRDSVNSDVVAERGQMNLMTSGGGVSHSEYSVGDGPVTLDALQFWIALPEASCTGIGTFEQHSDLPRVALPSDDGPAGEAVVVMGEFAGVASPATVHHPTVGAEIRLEPETRLSIPLHIGFEHAVLVVDGDAHAAAKEVPVGSMLFLGDSRDRVELYTEEGALLFLLGGALFEEDLVMWWNFAGRTHEDVAAAREDWEAQSDRFGHVVGHGDERIPAPPMPAVHLKPRRRRAA